MPLRGEVIGNSMTRSKNSDIEAASSGWAG